MRFLSQCLICRYLKLKCIFKDAIFIPYYPHLIFSASEEGLKGRVVKMKEESEKLGLKLNIQKTKIMSSGPITSWEIDGETVETVSDFIFWGLQNHCRW